ncbi:MAG: hypothetical protein GTO51_04100 [Candidatus Latescibacteria bacterium]|nr:hypothetical protein [Candidatus Latescibacterota bacterium]NIM21022.1 hypothetical protein [Candidatus Latescibacterota bacterium]NIM65157.1 hypothetical protein [Candidatus Latescibacterota bacterium]NIO01672.1 hypothetical protein [Candidatus Latescibacterota bacterium]NIO28189.1 hypothetical protein [Candidatus Latescibacterota bacterium]
MIFRLVKTIVCSLLLTATISIPLSTSAISLRAIPRSDPSLGVEIPAPTTVATAACAFQEMRPFEAGGEVSQGKAVLYSLLLPGLGDYYLGRHGRARVFILTEAAVWTSFIVFEVQGYVRREGYKEFAVSFAGITGMDHSDDYYRLLTRFNSSREYEEAIKMDGRYELFPNADRSALDNYYLTHRVSDFEPWEWPSDQKRREYRGIRKGSRQAFRRAIYSIAAAAANRVVSSLFALKAARDINKHHVSAHGRFYIEFGYPRLDPSDPFRTGLVLTRTF